MKCACDNRAELGKEGCFMLRENRFRVRGCGEGIAAKKELVDKFYGAMAC